MMTKIAPSSDNSQRVLRHVGVPLGVARFGTGVMVYINAYGSLPAASILLISILGDIQITMSSNVVVCA